MAALVADAMDCEFKGELGENLAAGNVVASDIIYKNSFVAFAAAGGIQPVVGDLVFAGIAVEQVDNSAGALGDKVVKYVRGGRVRMKNVAGMNLTDEGQLLYCATDNPADVTVVGAGAALIGMVTRYYSATDIEVELNNNRV